MTFGWLVLLPIILAGHASIWIPLWNRVESTAMPMWIKSLLSGAAKVACILLPPIVLAGWVIPRQLPHIHTFAEVYTMLCIFVSLLVLPSGLVRRFNRTWESGLRGYFSQVHKVEDAAILSRRNPQKKRNRLLFSIPWNQSFEFESNFKEIEIPDLAPELDGISIAHLTDLHFTGQVAKPFFDRAIASVNEMDADIIAVTGDLVDNPRCFEWLPSTLGKLRARHGVYVILGNHDCRNDLGMLRSQLSDLGLYNLGGRSKWLDIKGQKILLAGNELPWIAPATDMAGIPSKEDVPHLRVLLSHSPDQIEWARHFGFDLMLAGHTHGGQFRIPWFGAVVCPSSRPLAFSSGMFYEPPTMLHVSRGLSGEVPLRLNCRPEVTKVVLKCPELIHMEYAHRMEIQALANLRGEIENYVTDEKVGAVHEQSGVESAAELQETRL